MESRPCLAVIRGVTQMMKKRSNRKERKRAKLAERTMLDAIAAGELYVGARVILTGVNERHRDAVFVVERADHNGITFRSGGFTVYALSNFTNWRYA